MLLCLQDYSWNSSLLSSRNVPKEGTKSAVEISDGHDYIDDQLQWNNYCLPYLQVVEHSPPWCSRVSQPWMLSKSLENLFISSIFWIVVSHLTQINFLFMYLIFIRIMSKFRYYQWRILHVRLKYVMILICNPALRQQAHNLVGWYKAVYKYLYYYCY